MDRYLYHGSNRFIAKELKPHISFHAFSYLYASSDMLYALVRCGRFDGRILIREDYTGNKYQLCELEPGVFKEVFDCEGWIYLLREGDFGPLVDGMPNEYVTPNAQEYVSAIHIENVWREINKPEYKDYYELIRYEDADDEYWSHVTGGRKGYIKRRKERSEKWNMDIEKYIEGLIFANSKKEDVRNAVLELYGNVPGFDEVFDKLWSKEYSVKDAIVIFDTRREKR